MTYWANFVKYENPSYTMDKSDAGYWRPFVNDSNAMSRMSAEEKMKAANYLFFTNKETTMNSGLSEHKCVFWNYTVDSNLGIKSSPISYPEILVGLFASFFAYFN